MQLQDISAITEILTILLAVYVSYVLTVFVGIIRYGTGIRSRLWGTAWGLLVVVASFYGVSAFLGIEYAEIFFIPILLPTSLLIYDGSFETVRKGLEKLIYMVIGIAGILLVIIQNTLLLSYAIIATPVGWIFALSCFYTARNLKKQVEEHFFDFWFLYSGFMVLGISTLIYPINFLFSVENLVSVQLFVFTTGIILTGSGMFAYFIQVTKRNLKDQNSMSILMNGIIQHDIRNYVIKINQSIDLSLEDPSQTEKMLAFTRRAAKSMSDFINHVSRAMSATSRYEKLKTSISLSEVIEEVMDRVSLEYEIDKSSTLIEVNPDTKVLTNPIIREVLWNIIDNAYKHGSNSLRIQEERNRGNHILVISDSAGGMNKRLLDFLNNPNALDNESAPGMGLGIILIRGIASLCDLRISVSNSEENGEVVGTIYRLKFDLAKN